MDNRIPPCSAPVQDMVGGGGFSYVLPWFSAFYTFAGSQGMQFLVKLDSLALYSALPAASQSSVLLRRAGGVGLRLWRCVCVICAVCVAFILSLWELVVTLGSPRIFHRSVSFAEALVAPNDDICGLLTSVEAPPSEVLCSS